MSWTQIKDKALNSSQLSREDLAYLLSEEARDKLDDIKSLAAHVTKQRFGNTIKLYAPLYLSSHCSNQCPYCSFGSQNDIARRSLSIDEALIEADELIDQGHRHILLVAGEDRKSVTIDYLAKLAKLLRPKIAHLSVEVQIFDKPGYEKLCEAGVDGVTLYQETYDKKAYAKYHKAGSKADYDARMMAIESAGKAGMRFLGIGALLGLSDWRNEVFSIYDHACHLSKSCWTSHISISFPRIQPNAGNFAPPHPVSDLDLLQMIAGLRLSRPDDDFVLSTREPAQLRQSFINAGITRMSAGSRTSPGAYKLCDQRGDQFDVADLRSAGDVAKDIAASGFEPVWKDWV